MSNPAIIMDNLIAQFDRILVECGVVSIRRSIASAKKQNKPETDLISVIAQAAEKMSFVKLENRYAECLDLVAEIAATVSDDSYFSHIDLPTLPEITHIKEENIKKFVIYVGNLRALIQPLIDEEIGRRYQNELLTAIDAKRKQQDKGFYYEFTDGDLKRVQTLINELRAQIAESNLFEEGHRARLLKRLEKLQAEMHKKMSDVDRLWGLIGDAGVVIGKFGKDARPLVQRIKELTEITWRTQSRAEELPSSSENPLLEGHEES